MDWNITSGFESKLVYVGGVLYLDSSYDLILKAHIKIILR